MRAPQKQDAHVTFRSKFNINTGLQNKKGDKNKKSFVFNCVHNDHFFKILFTMTMNKRSKNQSTVHCKGEGGQSIKS